MAAAPAGAATGDPLTLTASAPATIAVGSDLPVTLTLANSGPDSCAVLRIATGALHITAGTRDGTPLVPEFASATTINGTPALAEANRATLAPGASITITSLGLTGFAFLPNHSALAATWPTELPGAYTFRLAYAVPGLVGADACPGTSTVATLSFAVGAAGATSAGGLPLWADIAIGIGTLILLVAIFLLLLRRRHRGAATVLLLVAAALVSTGHSTPAHAEVYFDKNQSDAAQTTYDKCKATIRRLDPGLLEALGGTDSEILVKNQGNGESVYRRDPVTGEVVGQINWDYAADGPIPGDPGVSYDPCSTLYHELSHMRDALDGSSSDLYCGGTSTLLDELRTTIRENSFRARSGIKPLRTNYDGVSLDMLAACVPAKGPATGGVRHCGAVCALSTGDPHITTFDAKRFDFQAVGEFTAAADANLSIQIRQAPLIDSRTVAVNTAIALSAAGNRLGFSLVNGSMTVHRDGAAVTVAPGTTTLSGGVTLSRYTDPATGDSFDVTLADGTVLTVWQASIYGLVAEVTPAAGRVASLTGLLAAPSSPGSPDAVRITDATSAFDYSPGQSTATFTDRTFPDRTQTAGDLAEPLRSAAAAACRAAGVTELTDLDDCTLDVSATGDPGFAAASAALASVTGRAAAGPGGGPAGGEPQTLQLDQAGDVAQFTFTATAGQRAYVDVPATTLPDSCGNLYLVDPSGAQIGDGCFHGGRGELDTVALHSTGVYAVEVKGTAPGSVTAAVWLSTDQPQPITADGPPTTLVVRVPGGRGLATFTAAAGEKVFIDASDATTGDGCLLWLDGPEQSRQVLGCLHDGVGYLDGTKLGLAGTYTVDLDPDGSTTGAVTVRLITDHDQTLSTAIGAAPVTATVAQPGAASRVGFTAAAGQSVTISFSGSTLPDGCGSLSLLAPDDSALDIGCVTNGTGALSATVAATGSYTVLVDPEGRATGAVTVQVAAA